MRLLHPLRKHRHTDQTTPPQCSSPPGEGVGGDEDDGDEEEGEADGEGGEADGQAGSGGPREGEGAEDGRDQAAAQPVRTYILLDTACSRAGYISLQDSGAVSTHPSHRANPKPAPTRTPDLIQGRLGTSPETWINPIFCSIAVKKRQERTTKSKDDMRTDG